MASNGVGNSNEDTLYGWPVERKPDMFKGVSFDVAWNYTVTDIYDFLLSAAQNPQNYRFSENDKCLGSRRNKLENIRQQIMEWSIPIENMQKYRQGTANPRNYTWALPQPQKAETHEQKQKRECVKANLCAEMVPYQHIARKQDPKYTTGQRSDTAKFKVNSYKIQLYDDKNTYENPQDGHTFSFFNPYDLLGLFMHFLGPSPANVQKDNYFLPLTAVYGRWCSMIAGNKAKGYAEDCEVDVIGVSQLPAVFQCTWQDMGSEPHPFFLGSSLSGYAKDDKLWEKEVKLARYKVLMKCPGMKTKFAENGYSFDLSPNIQAADEQDGQQTKGEKGNGTNAPKAQRVSRTLFGNCGETYPFAALMYGTADNRREALLSSKKRTEDSPFRGLALLSGYIKSNSDSTQLLHDYLIPPCRNCIALLNVFGARCHETYFHPFSGMASYKNQLPRRSGSTGDIAGPLSTATPFCSEPI